jgi:hypothetical protein
MLDFGSPFKARNPFDIMMHIEYFLMMRTTINLPDPLLAEARRRAAETGRTLTAFVADAVRESLARRKAKERRPMRLTTFRGSGLQPGVDLDDSAALEDLMNGRDAADRR